MAMIKCPECGQTVSDKAAKCEHCGYKLKNNVKRNVIIAIVIVVLIAAIALAISRSSAKKEYFDKVAQVFKVHELQVSLFDEEKEDLYKDKNYNKYLDASIENMVQLKEIRTSLTKPPKGEEEFNELLINYVDNEVKMAKLIIDSKGSYNGMDIDFDRMLDEQADLRERMELAEKD